MTQKNSVIGYIGTYTKGESKGIYSFRLDQKKGKLQDVKLAAELDNPTYMAVSLDRNFLYSVTKEGASGGTAAFAIDQGSGELKKINIHVSPGPPPCHLSVDSQNQMLFTANYHKGTLEAFLVSVDGSINSTLSVAEHKGSGPDPRQEKAHTHYSGFTPDEKFVVAVELGIDEILTYKLNEDKLEKVNTLKVKSGSGPRHLVFHPNGIHAYVMTEFSSEIIVLTFKEETGSFLEVQYISTIPKDFKENNQGSAIHISPDGNYLYAGNRGHNSIGVFKVDDKTKELSFVERVSTEGDWPRDFSLDPSGKFIVAANQNSNTLTLFSRDEQTGRLSLLEQKIPAPEPVCIKFL